MNRNRLWVLAAAMIGFLFQPSLGQEQPRRVPTDANFANLINDSKASFASCVALLTATPRPDRCSVLLMRSGKEGITGGAVIETASYLPKSGNPVAGKTEAVTGYFRASLPADELSDRLNAEAHTGPILKRAMSPQSVAGDSTVVVLRGSEIDASLLIKNAQESQFIVEQESAPGTFDANLRHLRNRKSSQEMTIFDFSPRSPNAMWAMGLNDDIKRWQLFSRNIKRSIEKQSSGASSTAPRTLAALKARLMDPSGSVVVVYGHSDGTKILLDTEEGIQSLSAEDIAEIGRQAGKPLPPILLLNCNTRSEIAPAFLGAGSPLVMTSDRALRIDDIAAFVDALSQRVFKERQDVLDAFFDVQQKQSLIGMRAIADASAPLNLIPPS